MKSLVLLLSFAALLFSCKKLGGKKGDFEFPCDASTCEVCGDDNYNNPDGVGSDVKVYYVEPITRSADGLCETGGFVKYLKNGKTVALVKYGTDEDGSYGIKTICVNGDCEHKNASTCTFRVYCTEIHDSDGRLGPPETDPNAN
ncbi:MAG: hypothetical protein CL840_14615 [Crocinitomicaceae bacterium]|nr:hypothetical protein [Crocinitomicaceae bacterium]|tara:strand:- start:747 stop:1178 length:432 start_codon:yes stop_codon:yes gene_type:complete